MRKKYFIITLLSILSSCISQHMAPIEFKDIEDISAHNNISKRRDSKVHYSESTVNAISNEEIIVKNQISHKEHKDYPSGTLHVKSKIHENTASATDLDTTRKDATHIAKKVDKQIIHSKSTEQQNPAIQQSKNNKTLDEELHDINDTDISNSNHTAIIGTPNKVEQDEDSQKYVIPESAHKIDDDAGDTPEQKFEMPVSGVVVTKFGSLVNGKKSNGIDIEADEGQAIRSISSGTVVYSGEDQRFGNLIIVKLDNSDMFAAYANMSDLIFAQNDKVSKGQIIGHVGSTGIAQRAQLHFALRIGKAPVDPMLYMK